MNNATTLLSSLFPILSQNFVGDATWGALLPSRFSEARSLPCFDVHDLHSVDSGVAAGLAEWLPRPESWDVLVAHTLGVDHAGHAAGVNSAPMLAKLRQTDALVRELVEAMAARAGAGEPYERTLALIFGDHGRDGSDSRWAVPEVVVRFDSRMGWVGET